MNFADNLKRICTERGTSPTALVERTDYLLAHDVQGR